MQNENILSYTYSIFESFYAKLNARKGRKISLTFDAFYYFNTENLYAYI